LETQARLIVDIARLDEDGESFSGETDAEALDFAGTKALCTPVGGIRYGVHVERIGSELLIRGQISHLFACVCSRCAKRFELEVAENNFFANFPITETTEFVDLTPEMREAIILALPGYPVCREDCKGICAHCGADLNRKPCSCRPEAGDASPWAALDQLGGKPKR
jgi:uncharacterized protein